MQEKILRKNPTPIKRYTGKSEKEFSIETYNFDDSHSTKDKTNSYRKKNRLSKKEYNITT